MIVMLRRASVIAALALMSLACVGLSDSAYAYRCGQSRPCPGGLNPYNPDSYNKVAEHGYNSSGWMSGATGGTTPSTKIVHPGQNATLYHFYSINPDCTTRGHFEIKLLSQPHGGSVSIRSGADYPNFPLTNERSVCNRRKSPVDQVVYRASAGFSGEDDFQVEAIGPDHRARQVHLTVNVE